MNHAIIQTEGLRFAYAEEGAVNPFVLDGVSLDIEEGSFVAVLGHNGSGKSTLAKHLNANPAALRRQSLRGRHRHRRRG